MSRVGIQMRRKLCVTLIITLPPLQLKWTSQRVVILFIARYKRLSGWSAAPSKRPTRPFHQRLHGRVRRKWSLWISRCASNNSRSATGIRFICIRTLMNKQTSHLYRAHTHNTVAAKAQGHTRCRRRKRRVFCSILANQWESGEHSVSHWLGNEPSSRSGLISVLHSDFSAVSLCDRLSLFWLLYTQANGAQNILMSQKSRDTEETGVQSLNSINLS